MRTLLIGSAITPIFFFFGVIFIIHSEYHVGAGIKWVLIWLVDVSGLGNNILPYRAVLIGLSGFTAAAFSLNLLVTYHLTVSCVMLARGSVQMLQAMIK